MSGIEKKIVCFARGSDVKFAGVDFFYYNVACFVAIFFISCVILMAIFALNKLGFEFEYKSLEK